MNAYLTSRRATLAAVGGLLAALSLSGVAQAVTDTIFRYTTTKTGYFGIDAMAMSPGGTAAADDYDISVLDGLTTLTGIRCFNTGVNLPHGATMTQLAVWTLSGGSTADPQVYLYRRKLMDGSAEAVVPAHLIVDDSGNRKRTNIAIANTATAVVNNAGYTYAFGLCIANADRFYGARITYTYTHAGD